MTPVEAQPIRSSAHRLSDAVAIAVMIAAVLLLTLGAGYALGSERVCACGEVGR